MNKNTVIFFILTFFAFCFFSWNLSGQGYTLDEPATIGVAKTVLHFGYPSPGDGKNDYGNLTWEYKEFQGRYFWTWHPWLPFYFIAPMYALFGNSIAMLRLPFVLFGALTVGAIYFISNEFFKNKLVSILISLQLTFLLTFFLYVRQAHYYSPAAFFSLILLWLYWKSMQTSLNKKLVSLIFIVGFLLFQTNYLVWLSDMAILFILTCWKRKPSYYILLALSGIYGFLWFLVLQPYNGNTLSAYAGRTNLLLTIFHNISYLNNYVFPLIIGIFCFFAAYKLTQLRTYFLLIFVIGVKVFMYSLLVDPHGRFLVDIMPLCLLLYGFLYILLLRSRLSILILFIFLLVTTSNIVSVFPAYLFNVNKQLLRFYPNEFAAEFSVKTEYEYVQIGQFLSANEKKNDVFWINTDNWSTELYTDTPMLDAICDIKTNRFTGPSLYKDPSKVRWYIFDTNVSTALTTTPCLGEKWEKYLIKNYTKKVLSLNTKTYQLNDTDIVNRSFPPIPKYDKIVIYEKKNRL
ncbi:MAG TPA: glycosyltransferase family 39 protein [Verrucomicrobiae bacterium]|nr:glycosyltransferase family 39 protein [Verrucomicrobiae bacterium]